MFQYQKIRKYKYRNKFLSQIKLELLYYQTYVIDLYIEFDWE